MADSDPPLAYIGTLRAELKRATRANLEAFLEFEREFEKGAESMARLREAAAALSEAWPTSPSTPE